jgi:hypothetical protein
MVITFHGKDVRSISTKDATETLCLQLLRSESTWSDKTTETRKKGGEKGVVIYSLLIIVLCELA